MPAPATAQDEDFVADDAEAAGAEGGEVDFSRIDDMLKQDEAVQSNDEIGASYDPGARRDPFRSLIVRRNNDEEVERERPEGAEGVGSPQPELDVFGRAPKGRPDWSHRKGEPRVFALMWMMYLMGASLLMVTSIAAVQSISPNVVRPAARAMLITATIGICVLWPMVRLSQRRPEKTVLGAVAADLVVLLPPLAALALPQALNVLANWPMQVVWALLAGLTGWAVLIGAVLALALRTVGRGTGGASEEWHRVLWMLLRLHTLILTLHVELCYYFCLVLLSLNCQGREKR